MITATTFFAQLNLKLYSVSYEILFVNTRNNVCFMLHISSKFLHEEKTIIKICRISCGRKKDNYFMGLPFQTEDPLVIVSL